MKLSEWARQAGVRYETAWRWYKAGILPVPATRLPTGTILVLPLAPPSPSVALYARVSSHDQKADLAWQTARLVTCATGKGYTVGKVDEEAGSGLDDQRFKDLVNFSLIFPLLHDFCERCPLQS